VPERSQIDGVFMLSTSFQAVLSLDVNPFVFVDRLMWGLPWCLQSRLLVVAGVLLSFLNKKQPRMQQPWGDFLLQNGTFTFFYHIL